MAPDSRRSLNCGILLPSLPALLVSTARLNCDSAIIGTLNSFANAFKLKALLHIQKFIEEDGGGGFGGTGLPGNWKPVSDMDGDGGAKVFLQTGSKMNDSSAYDDDDSPF